MACPIISKSAQNVFFEAWDFPRVSWLISTHLANMKHLIWWDFWWFMRIKMAFTPNNKYGHFNTMYWTSALNVALLRSDLTKPSRTDAKSDTSVHSFKLYFQHFYIFTKTCNVWTTRTPCVYSKTTYDDWVHLSTWVTVISDTHYYNILST